MLRAIATGVLAIGIVALVSALSLVRRDAPVTAAGAGARMVIPNIATDAGNPAPPATTEPGDSEITFTFVLKFPLSALEGEIVLTGHFHGPAPAVGRPPRLALVEYSNPEYKKGSSHCQLVFPGAEELGVFYVSRSPSQVAFDLFAESRTVWHVTITCPSQELELDLPLLILWESVFGAYRDTGQRYVFQLAPASTARCRVLNGEFQGDGIAANGWLTIYVHGAGCLQP